jgi:hypothetical protein
MPFVPLRMILDPAENHADRQIISLFQFTTDRNTYADPIGQIWIRADNDGEIRHLAWMFSRDSFLPAS